MPMTLLCDLQTCQKPFQRQPSAVRQTNFCSRSCADIAKRFPSIPKECAYCGQSFMVTPHQIATNKMYCGPVCSHKAQAAALRGKGLESQPFWDNVQHCQHEWLCFYCCWPWTGSLANGYGYIIINSRQEGTHRIAWALGNNRPFPEGLFGAHYCHFRACCNFMHIHAATPKENIADSVRDGRHTRGEMQGNSKLTEDTVREAFKLRKERQTTKAIALHLSVSEVTIKHLLQRRTWKYLSIDDLL